MLIVDGLHAAGLALLFLAVIPGFDSVAAVVISSCTCFVPGLLSKEKTTTTIIIEDLLVQYKYILQML